MKALCYFHNPDEPGCKYPERLIAQWRKSFENHGFEAKVLTEKDAARHPYYRWCLNVINNLPTANQRTYENACWLRWLAFEMEAPALCLDYDVINLSLTPEMVPIDDFIAMGPHSILGAEYGTRKGIRTLIERFPSAVHYIETVKGVPHVSDMMLILPLLRCHTAQLIANCDWDKAAEYALVHFPNDFQPLEQRHEKRWVAVNEFFNRNGLDPLLDVTA